MKPLVFVLTLCAGFSLAQAQTFTASLNGAQDGGGARQGSGFVTLVLTGSSLSLTGSFSGLTTSVSAGHIHGPAPAGLNANVIYDLFGTGILTGTTSGTYAGVVNLIPNPTGYSSIAQQVTDLNAGLWYLNIHDSTFPGGEIRGQILPIPEPATAGLSMIGAGALIYGIRRHRKSRRQLST